MIEGSQSSWLNLAAYLPVIHPAPGTRQPQDGYLILIFLMADNQAVAGVGAGGVITTVMAGNSSSQTVSK